MHRNLCTERTISDCDACMMRDVIVIQSGIQTVYVGEHR